MANILVVDDSPIVRRTLEFILKKQNHTVMTANDGTEALARLAEVKVELIFADVSMPHLDGIDLLQRLRADIRFRHLPVVMLTASGETQDRLRAEKEGANGFLTKPASSQELIATVNRFVKGS
ncbi:MAG: response regulator [Chloroflexi bacterium]|nr:response regulator [Chloroflexota bacterium]MBP8059925.1 response regulator [Chloroflexota bacterium]